MRGFLLLVSFAALICQFDFVAAPHCVAADTSESEKIIAEAIRLMEKKRDSLTDTLQQARVDKAIRELEAILDNANSETPINSIQISLETLKKKFAGRSIYDPHSGELTIKYDFPGKAQLDDFEIGKKRVLVAKKMLAVKAGDELKHVAQFKTVTVSAIMFCKSLQGSGIDSADGSGLRTGGINRDTIYLVAAGGTTSNKIIPDQLRQGNIPVVMNCSPHKISVRFGREVLTVPAVNTNAVHQVVLRGGTEGCGFSNLVITGIPDEAWLKEFLSRQ